MPGTGPSYHVPVHAWPEGERPREKLGQLGAEFLSNGELLAILFQTGGARDQGAVQVSQGRLTSHGGVGGLSKLSQTELMQARGIGQAKSATLMAAFELGRRALLSDTGERIQVRSAQDVATLLEVRLRGLGSGAAARRAALDAKSRPQDLSGVCR